FDGMNRKRDKFDNFLPNHCNKNSSLYIPINGNYISGFIAGDGSINIHPFSLTFNTSKFCGIFLILTHYKIILFLFNYIKNVIKILPFHNQYTVIYIEDLEYVIDLIIIIHLISNFIFLNFLEIF